MVQIINFIRRFLTDQDGAVTVDLVVLTAAICISGFTALSAFDDAAIGLAIEIETAMDDMSP